MTEYELRELLAAPESEHVERTRAFDKVDKMGEAVCAFANDISGSGATGYLLLGVEDDGRISGRRIDDEKWASLGGLKTDGNILPPPSMSMEKFSLAEGDVIVIQRDYFLGNAPIKFYEYKHNRIEISNPGGLFGRATPDNFPFVNDYRNPLLAEAMKVLGMVNKYNRGIAKVNHELEKNGNARAQFDVNKRTEFRVTILASGKSEPINGRSEQTNGESEPINHDLKSINEPENLTYDVKSHDAAVLSVIKQRPGIKKDGIFLEVKTSIMSIRRSLDRLKTAQKVEYRGSNKTGGWYVRT